MRTIFIVFGAFLYFNYSRQLGEDYLYCLARK